VSRSAETCSFIRQVADDVDGDLTGGRGDRGRTS
jgi:hypothetical protein